MSTRSQWDSNQRPFDCQNDNLDKSTDEFDLIKHSPYYPDGNIPKGGSINTGILNILSLNCASINAKIDEIKIKLQEINNNGTEIHALCMQETWLSDDSDTSLLQIDDFNLIPQGKICSAHAGLLIVIYLRKDIKYKVLHVCPKSTIWEGQFIQLTEKLAKKKIVLGNNYIQT